MSRLTRARARQLLHAVRDSTALVLGDLMLDEYLFGDAERISQEAPVPVVHVRREACRPGGAGNVAANAAALGAGAVLVGTVGLDDTAELLRASLQRLGIPVERLVVDRGRPTTRKSRIIAQGQQVVRFDREDSGPVVHEIEAALIEQCLQALVDCDVVLLSDYAKGTLTERVLDGLLGPARERQVPVVVDPKGRSFDRYRPATALTPNHHEAALAAHADATPDDGTIEEIGRSLLAGKEVDMVLVTRGADGMSLIEREGGATHLKTAAREVFDVSGAGDTVSTIFALALAAGGTPVEAADLANHAAGVVVGKVGTATASGDEILASLSD